MGESRRELNGISRTQSVKTSQRHCTHVALCLSSNLRASCDVLLFGRFVLVSLVNRVRHLLQKQVSGMAGMARSQLAWLW